MRIKDEVFFFSPFFNGVIMDGHPIFYLWWIPATTNIYAFPEVKIYGRFSRVRIAIEFKRWQPTNEGLHRISLDVLNMTPRLSRFAMQQREKSLPQEESYLLKMERKEAEIRKVEKRTLLSFHFTLHKSLLTWDEL